MPGSQVRDLLNEVKAKGVSESTRNHPSPIRCLWEQLRHPSPITFPTVKMAVTLPKPCGGGEREQDGCLRNGSGHTWRPRGVLHVHLSRILPLRNEIFHLEYFITAVAKDSAPPTLSSEIGQVVHALVSLEILLRYLLPVTLCRMNFLRCDDSTPVLFVGTSWKLSIGKPQIIDQLMWKGNAMAWIRLALTNAAKRSWQVLLAPDDFRLPNCTHEACWLLRVSVTSSNWPQRINPEQSDLRVSSWMILKPFFITLSVHINWLSNMKYRKL